MVACDVGLAGAVLDGLMQFGIARPPFPLSDDLIIHLKNNEGLGKVALKKGKVSDKSKMGTGALSATTSMARALHARKSLACPLLGDTMRKNVTTFSICLWARYLR